MFDLTSPTNTNKGTSQIDHMVAHHTQPTRVEIVCINRWKKYPLEKISKSAEQTAE